jgi:hypothetical protein
VAFNLGICASEFQSDKITILQKRYKAPNYGCLAEYCCTAPLSASAKHVKHELDCQGAGQVKRQCACDLTNDPIGLARLRWYVHRLGRRLRR